MILTKNLCKVYYTEEIETTALNNINIDIKQGEFVSIMGPSGCGKSSLLHILGLLDSPSSGNFFLNGEDVSNYSQAQRLELRKGTIGFIFQNFNLIDELTVFENIELPLTYMKKPQLERKDLIESALNELGILHRRNHFPNQLSGGQQQRVAIARAIVLNPKVLFADEPTGNLDSNSGNEVMNILNELNRKGTTIVMVTHSAENAKLAQRSINILDGKIVSVG